MKRFGRLLLIAVSLLGFAAVSHANLIVNGSFETPNLSGSWDTFDSIAGWNRGGVEQIEVGAGSIYGVSGFDGNQVLELDSYGNALVSQQLALQAGASYTLSFLYALRANVAPGSGTFQVLWNGTVLDNFAPTSNVMTRYSRTVLAEASNTLSFLGTGDSDSYGAIIDDVRVPDGGLTAVLLGLGFAGLAMFRRMV